jgi:hypothetical protein
MENQTLLSKANDVIELALEDLETVSGGYPVSPPPPGGGGN